MPDFSEGEGSPVGFAADGAVLPRGGRRRRNPSGGMAGDAARARKSEAASHAWSRLPGDTPVSSQETPGAASFQQPSRVSGLSFRWPRTREGGRQPVRGAWPGLAWPGRHRLLFIIIIKPWF